MANSDKMDDDSLKRLAEELTSLCNRRGLAVEGGGNDGDGGGGDVRAGSSEE